MMKKPALGRGLSALIPQGPTAPGPVERDGLMTVDVGLLEASHLQPRRRFEDEQLAELAQSIKESGILQPVLVTRHGDGYRIIAGERRVRAAKLAGLKKIPVVVREGVEDRERLLLALVENVQRRDLTPLEEAAAFQQLREEFGMTQEEVAEKVGKDRATVANTIRLLRLPADVRQALEDGHLSSGHARAILALPSAADQEKVAREILKRKLTVRATEARVAELLGEAAAGRKKERRVDADTRDAELRLSRALGTKVEIKRRKKGGELRITYYSEEQLIGLFERFMRGEP